MKILNIREGFACNSSSTHSIIFTNEKVRDKDVDDAEFGWNEFICASPEAKTAWFAVSLQATLGQLKMDPEIAKLVVKHITGHDPIPYGYVDHQSQITFPRSWDGNGIDIEFAKEFYAYLMDPTCVILGGNDNSERELTVPKGTDVFYRSVFPVDTGPDIGWDGVLPQHKWVSRKDPSGYWTLFNRVNGKKVRLAFDPGYLEVEAAKAAMPELVDLKITDYCTYGCPTCYQGSTRDGKHARMEDIWAIARLLREAEVFEVAIGGGEPTLHPKFPQIVQTLHGKNIIVNVTTRDPRWFTRFPDLIPYLGGVAVSCDSEKEVEAALRAIENQAEPLRSTLKKMVRIQHILGIVPEYNLSSIFRHVKEARMGMVLLGYKTSHRGSTKNPETPKGMSWGEWLTNEIKKSNSIVPRPLGIDTVLVQELRGRVPDYLLTPMEGQFSCYIDVVNGPTMFASSFEPVPNPVPVDLRNIDSLRKAWQAIQPYSPASAYTYKKHLTTKF